MTFIEKERPHGAAGAFGGVLNAASNATPIIAGTTAAHGLQDGDQVQITGVLGNLAANGTFFVKVTGQSATTFGLYSDQALTAGVAGTGAYTSGGTVSMAYDISGLAADTIRVTLQSLTPGKKVLLAVQDSSDGFASDIKTLMVVNVSGGSTTPEAYSLRSYQMPSLRQGVPNARLRLNVQSIDSNASVICSLSFD